MPQRSTYHAMFVLERSLQATPQQVFAAWAQPEAKARWFGASDGWKSSGYELDFRVGGREALRSTPSGGGEAHVYEARYQDIVPNERIVYAYDMRLGDARISVSLATVELKPEETGTRMVYTEQAVFVDGGDGLDAAKARERGSRALLDSLERSLSGR